MIKMKTSTGEVAKVCEQIVHIIEDSVVEEFTEWAKKDDEYLRANNGFIDHTGNLRSSLGAAVAKDAKVVFSTPFQTVLGGSKGSAAGKNAIQRAASDMRNRMAKIMVAGMDYAQKVEDIDSKDVLDTRRIQCEREANDVIERAMRKAEDRIKRMSL